MMYVRDTVAQSVKPKATIRIRSYWWGNSDVALDGAGVKPAKSDHMDSQQCKVTTD